MTDNTSPPFYRSNATGETSAAAAGIAARGAPKLKERIYLRLEKAPSTPEELATWLAEEGLPALLTTIRARVCDLRREGLVVDAGTRGLGESRKAKTIRWRVLSQPERAATLYGEGGQ